LLHQLDSSIVPPPSSASAAKKRSVAYHGALSLGALPFVAEHNICVGNAMATMYFCATIFNARHGLGGSARTSFKGLHRNLSFTSVEKIKQCMEDLNRERLAIEHLTEEVQHQKSVILDINVPHDADHAASKSGGRQKPKLHVHTQEQGTPAKGVKIMINTPRPFGSATSALFGVPNEDNASFVGVDSTLTSADTEDSSPSVSVPRHLTRTNSTTMRVEACMDAVKSERNAVAKLHGEVENLRHVMDVVSTPRNATSTAPFSGDSNSSKDSIGLFEEIEQLKIVLAEKTMLLSSAEAARVTGEARIKDLLARNEALGLENIQLQELLNENLDDSNDKIDTVQESVRNFERQLHQDMESVPVSPVKIEVSPMKNGDSNDSVLHHQQLDALETEAADLRSRLEQSLKQESSLQSELANIHRDHELEVNKMKHAFSERLDEQRREWSQEKKFLLIENEQLKDQLLQKQRGLEVANQAQRDAADAEIAGLKEQIAILKKNLSQVSVESTSLQTQLLDFVEREKNLQEQLQTSTTQQETNQRDIDELKSLLEDKNKTLEKMKSSLLDLRSKKDALKSQVTAERSQIEALIEQMDQMKTENSSQSAVIASLLTDKTALNEALEELRTNAESESVYLTEKITVAHDFITQWRKASQLSVGVDSSVAATEDQDEADPATRLNSELQILMQALRNDREDNVSRIAALESKLQVQEASSAQLEQELATASANLKEATLALETMTLNKEESDNNLVARVQAAETEKLHSEAVGVLNDQLQSRLLSLEKEYSVAMEKLANAQTELTEAVLREQALLIQMEAFTTASRAVEDMNIQKTAILESEVKDLRAQMAALAVSHMEDKSVAENVLKDMQIKLEDAEKSSTLARDHGVSELVDELKAELEYTIAESDRRAEALAALEAKQQEWEVARQFHERLAAVADSLRADSDGVAAMNSELESLRKSLEQSMSTSTDQMVTSQHELASSQSEVHRLQLEIVRLQEETSALSDVHESELASLRIGNEERERSLLNDRRLLEEETNKLQLKLQNVIAENERLESTSAEGTERLEAELAALRVVSEQHKSDKQTAVNNIRTLELQVKVSQDRQTAMESEIANLIKKIEDLQASTAAKELAMQAEVSELRTQLQEVETAKEDLATSLEGNREVQDKESKMIAKLKQALIDMKSKKESLGEQVTQLAAENQILTEQTSSLSQQVMELQIAQQSAAESTTLDAAKDLTNLKDQLAASLGVAADCEEFDSVNGAACMSVLSITIASIKYTVRRYQEVVTSKMHELEAEITKHRHNESSLQAQMADITESCQRLEASLQEIVLNGQAETARLCEELNKCRSSLEADNEQLQSELIEARRQLEEAARSDEKLQQSQDTLRNQVDALETRLSDSESRCAASIADVAIAEAKIVQLEQQLEALKQSGIIGDLSDLDSDNGQETKSGSGSNNFRSRRPPSIVTSPDKMDVSANVSALTSMTSSVVSTAMTRKLTRYSSLYSTVGSESAAVEAEALRNTVDKLQNYFLTYTASMNNPSSPRAQISPKVVAAAGAQLKEALTHIKHLEEQLHAARKQLHWNQLQSDSFIEQIYSTVGDLHQAYMPRVPMFTKEGIPSPSSVRVLLNEFSKGVEALASDNEKTKAECEARVRELEDEKSVSTSYSNTLEQTCQELQVELTIALDVISNFEDKLYEDLDMMTSVRGICHSENFVFSPDGTVKKSIANHDSVNMSALTMSPIPHASMVSAASFSATDDSNVAQGASSASDEVISTLMDKNESLRLKLSDAETELNETHQELEQIRHEFDDFKLNTQQKLAAARSVTMSASSAAVATELNDLATRLFMDGDEHVAADDLGSIEADKLKTRKLMAENESRRVKLSRGADTSLTSHSFQSPVFGEKGTVIVNHGGSSSSAKSAGSSRKTSFDVSAPQTTLARQTSTQSRRGSELLTGSQSRHDSRLMMAFKIVIYVYFLAVYAVIGAILKKTFGK
jgi:chromosome segregation ATPase